MLWVAGEGHHGGTEIPATLLLIAQTASAERVLVLGNAGGSALTPLFQKQAPLQKGELRVLETTPEGKARAVSLSSYRSCPRICESQKAIGEGGTKRFILFSLAMSLAITLGGTVLLWKKIAALPAYFAALVTGASLVGLIPGLLSAWADRYSKDAIVRANRASLAAFLSVGTVVTLPAMFSASPVIGIDVGEVGIVFGALAALMANAVSRWCSRTGQREVLGLKNKMERLNE